jgi:hypothetical protein
MLPSMKLISVVACGFDVEGGLGSEQQQKQQKEDDVKLDRFVALWRVDDDCGLVRGACRGTCDNEISILRI